MFANLIENNVLLDKDYRVGIILSVLVHILFILFAIYGLPKIKTDKPSIEAPITIEFIDAEISEVTQTDKISNERIKKEKSEIKKPEIKRVIKTTPKMTQISPPKLSIPKPPEVNDADLAKIRDIKQPDLDAVRAPDNKKPKITAPVSTPKPYRKPDNPKLVKKETKLLTENNSEEFASLLKNIAPEVEANKNDDIPDAPLTKDDKKPLINRFGDKLTVSEQGALKSQLNSCWNFIIGAKNAKNLVVKLKLTVNPDRTVRQAVIVDKNRYNSDSFFRAAVDSALRAIKHPNCHELKLPPEKHEVWNIITVNFDPREVI